MSRPRAGRRPLYVLVVGVLVLAGCATSGYTYVANEDLGAYFRVPDTYEVYSSEQVLEEVVSDLPDEQADAVMSRMWAVAFDASDDPTVDRFLRQISEPAEELAGYARVRTLDNEQRLAYSLQSLRSELIPEQQMALLGDRLEVRDISEIRQEAGQGLKLTFSVDMPAGTLVFDQVGLVDDGTNRVYVLALGCSSECYEANRETIADITESWTIEER